MRVLSPSGISMHRPWLVAVLAGMFLAVCAAGLLRLPYVWAGLFTVGLMVGVGSLVAKDFRSYWLAIFALALPLDIRKLLIDSTYIRELAGLYGVPMGELPGPVIYLSDLPLLMLVGQWLVQVLVGKRRVELPRSNVFAIGYIVWCALSLAKAEVFSYAFFDFVRTIKFYVLYLYIANNIRTPGTLATLIRYLAIGVILQGAICCYQFFSQSIGHVFGNLFGVQELYSEESIAKFEQFFQVTPDSASKRASGTVGPINAEAQYFEYLLPMAFLLMWVRTSLASKLVHVSAFALGTVGLVLTFSRGGFVGIAVGLVVVLFLGRRFLVLKPWMFQTVALTGVLAGIALAPMAYEFMMTRHEATIARFHLYQVGIDMIRDAPILGVGLNNHIVHAPRYDPENYLFPTPTHNQYLLVASEVGIPGLAFLAAFIVSAMAEAWRAARRNDTYVAAVALGIIGAFAALGVHNLVDHLSYHTNLTLLWLFAGLATALRWTDTSPAEVEVVRTYEQEDGITALAR